MSTAKVLAVYGTRPEAIKMAPLVAELRASPQLDVVVAVTGQHRQMLDPVNELFGIVPRHDLSIIAPRQTLTDITSRCLLGLDAVLEAERPHAVVVQGDTTSAFAAALSASRVQHREMEATMRPREEGKKKEREKKGKFQTTTLLAREYEKWRWLAALPVRAGTTGRRELVYVVVRFRTMWRVLMLRWYIGR